MGNSLNKFSRCFNGGLVPSDNESLDSVNAHPPSPYRSPSPSSSEGARGVQHIQVGRAPSQEISINSTTSATSTSSSEEERQIFRERQMKMIEKLPKKRFSGTSIRECVICMVEIQPDEEIRTLPCTHYYHAQCIDQWLIRSAVCPSCMETLDFS